jgi:glycosyltransferase involved in cell wall biosynthesis
MVGRLHRVKDYPTALRAWRRVVDRRPGKTLTIVGDGPERATLEDARDRLGLTSVVRFRGEVEAASELHGARMFLSTARAEGFSRALLEALAVGVPAVCTAVGGAAELSGEGVRLVPVGDDAAVAAEVLDWLEASERLAAAGKAARQLGARYSPERCHAAYAGLYAEVTRR